MGINIEDNGVPEADVAEDRDPLNPDTYEEGDDNGNSNVQV